MLSTIYYNRAEKKKNAPSILALILKPFFGLPYT